MGDIEYDGQTIQTNGMFWNQRGYLPPQSVTPIKFTASIDSLRLSALVKRAPAYDWNPDITSVIAGLWVKMIDPYGNQSSAVMKVTEIGYSKSKMICTSWEVPDTSIQMPTFRMPDPDLNPR